MAHMGEHTIVIGGSLAGLAAAATLVERYDRVTVVERDRLPTDAQHRPGVPQGQHGHILLPAGLRDLTDLFPGIVNDLRANGAHIVGMPDVRFHIADGHLCPDDATLELVGATRPLLEAVVRARERPWFPVVALAGGRGVRAAARGAFPHRRDPRAAVRGRSPNAHGHRTGCLSSDVMDSAHAERPRSRTAA